MTDDHGRCPSCKADMNGGGIYAHYLAETGDPAEAARMAKMFGADEHHGQWGRQIAIYSREADRTVAWKCPDCGHEWDRLNRR